MSYGLQAKSDLHAPPELGMMLSLNCYCSPPRIQQGKPRFNHCMYTWLFNNETQAPT